MSKFVEVGDRRFMKHIPFEWISDNKLPEIPKLPNFRSPLQNIYYRAALILPEHAVISLAKISDSGLIQGYSDEYFVVQKPSAQVMMQRAVNGEQTAKIKLNEEFLLGGLFYPRIFIENNHGYAFPAYIIELMKALRKELGWTIKRDAVQLLTQAGLWLTKGNKDWKKPSR